MRERQHMLSVWFFIGLLLLVYGIIILAVGICKFSHPAPVVLAGDHLNLWCGGLLVALGGFYTIRYRP